MLFRVQSTHFATVKRPERGATMVEFMIALPFMLLLFLGLFEVGRILSHSDVLSQDMCSAALYGAGIPGPVSVRKEKTEQMAYSIFNATAKKEFGAAGPDITPVATPEIEAEFNSEGGWVKLSFTGVMRILLPALFGREISKTCYIPELGAGALEFATDFTNPNPPFCRVNLQMATCPATSAPTVDPWCIRFPQLCNATIQPPTWSPAVATPTGWASFTPVPTFGPATATPGGVPLD